MLFFAKTVILGYVFIVYRHKLQKTRQRKDLETSIFS